MLVRLTAAHQYVTDRLENLVDSLLDQQLDDGGWNCQARGDRGKHSSFHTTIQALEALHAYQEIGGTANNGAHAQGREFFLRHRLYKSHRTGQVAIPRSTRFPQLPQWHFDVMRGLEYFVDAGSDQDQRLEDAVAVVRHARRADGRWPTYAGYPGRHWFRMEDSGASRWNTIERSVS